MNKMDTSHFQETARRDRNKLVAGVVVMAVASVALILAAALLGSAAIALGVLAPVAAAAFAVAGYLGLRLAGKMERDSYEEGMHLVMEGSPMNCTITDDKGAVLYCNDRAASMFNASKSEYARELFRDFLPEIQPDGTPSMEMAGRHIQTAFRNGTDSFDWWHQMGPGKEQFPCTVNLAAASVYGMSRILVFLSDQRKAQVLKRQEEALKERMQAVLDAAPILCGIYDADGNVMEMNKEAERLFGIPNKQLMITNYSDFLPPRQPDGSDSLKKTDETLRRVLREGSYEHEWVYQYKDGAPIQTTETLNCIEVDGKKMVISYSRDLRAEYAAREAEAAAQKRLNAMMDKLNGQLESQSAAINESSAAIEEMIANTRSVSGTLSRNAQNVQDLQEASAIGHSGLNEVVTDIREIARESESLLEINSVMQNIASQTNLLSMNAAIEAAHAGEAGRGFAVVADEIRKLAESSSKQSKTIGAVLKKIKGSIDKITKSTDNVMNKFEAIDGGVKTVAEQEHGILNAMSEQSAGSAQIMQAIAQVNDITGQVKEDARQMVEAAAKLGV